MRAAEKGKSPKPVAKPQAEPPAKENVSQPGKGNPNQSFGKGSGPQNNFYPQPNGWTKVGPPNPNPQGKGKGWNSKGGKGKGTFGGRGKGWGRGNPAPPNKYFQSGESQPMYETAPSPSNAQAYGGHGQSGLRGIGLCGLPTFPNFPHFLSLLPSRAPPAAPPRD